MYKYLQGELNSLYYIEGEIIDKKDKGEDDV